MSSSNPADEYAARVKREREENPVNIPIDSLDENIVAELPAGHTVLSIVPSGVSAWCQTIRIETKLEDGTIKKFFWKTKTGETGRRMMEGSFHSETEFYKFIPDHVPRPVAWGELKSEPGTWYYLSEFHDMVDELPDAQTFVSIIARVHKESMGKSPTGKYGFQVATHLADVPTENTWQDSWEVWYLQALQEMWIFEQKTQGEDAEFTTIFEDFCQKVVPRLLRPLETGGRAIEPCLIHADQWPGNCMPDVESGLLMIFDSCAFWGHNEVDLGTWRAPRYRFGRPFFKEYQKIMGISEPHADWDDRNALYAVRYDLLLSGLFPKETKFRQMARSEMQRLIDKHPNGLDGFQHEESGFTPGGAEICSGVYVL